MAKPYPMELRDRAVKFVQACESRHAVASRLGLGAATVIRWLDRFENTGTVAASKFGGYRKPKIVGTHRDWLLERIKRGVFTLQDLASELEGRRLKVDYKTVWKFVHREDLSCPVKEMVTKDDRPVAFSSRQQHPPVADHHGRRIIVRELAYFPPSHIARSRLPSLCIFRKPDEDGFGRAPQSLRASF